MNADNFSTNLPNGNDADDCDWQAVRYVLGEMGHAERDRFESRIEADLQTCERVAAAVGLLAAIGLAEETKFPCSSRPAAKTAALRMVDANRRWTALAVAAAACVLLAFGLHRPPLNPGNVGRPNVSNLSDAAADYLVATWSEWQAGPAIDPEGAESAAGTELTTGAELTTSSMPLDESQTIEVAEQDSGESIPGANSAAVTSVGENLPGEAATKLGHSSNSAGELDVPGWLIAAVSLDEKTRVDSSASETWEN
jgi:hypothetical protein